MFIGYTVFIEYIHTNPKLCVSANAIIMLIRANSLNREKGSLKLKFYIF